MIKASTTDDIIPAWRKIAESGPIVVPLVKGREDKPGIQCDSVEFGKTLCAAGGTVKDVTLKRQDSSAPCTKGETFGWEGSNIWADKGCRGNFMVAISGIQCDSVEFGKTLCAAGGTVEDVTLRRQDSSTTCTKGETFGWEESNIWADKGCR